jgi:hypothetical protein
MPAAGQAGQIGVHERRPGGVVDGAQQRRVEFAAPRRDDGKLRQRLQVQASARGGTGSTPFGGRQHRVAVENR